MAVVIEWFMVRSYIDINLIAAYALMTTPKPLSS